MKLAQTIALAALFMSATACANPDPVTDSTPDENHSASPSGVVADVDEVTISGNSGAYTFAVKLSSPDTGCDQYADWWEVITPEGVLLYRRILAHSHVDEQPFTRSGGPVSIEANARVIVRAHMNTGGYGGRALEVAPDGSVQQEIALEDGFADDLASEAPLPNGCAF